MNSRARIPSEQKSLAGTGHGGADHTWPYDATGDKMQHTADGPPPPSNQQTTLNSTPHAVCGKKGESIHQVEI